MDPGELNRGKRSGAREVARPVPDKLSIWPVEGGRFGIDATFTGVSGYDRAERHERILSAAGVRLQRPQRQRPARGVKRAPEPLTRPSSRTVKAPCTPRRE
jgi:hypothetical protein